ncbi:MAG: DUF6489 family protein [Micropepsaceae bacterium]
MKITIEVDCTPAEARAYMGLPDVEPLQAEVMGEIQRRAMQALAMTDPQQLLKNWVPWGAQGLEAFQNIMRTATGGHKSPERDEEPAPKPRSRS